jgi:hypothetical protein
MKQDLSHSIVGVRDFAYLSHRYLNHPTKSYHIFVVKNRLTQQYQGLVVLNIENKRGEILDIISPLKNIPLLIRHAQRFAALHECNHLICQISDNFSSYFKNEMTHYQLTDISIPTNQWTASPSAELLKNKWWLMAGDMDFK